MRFLLDTHILLWSVGNSRRLSETICSWLTDKKNDVYFSAANIWEIVIKSSLAKSDFQVDVDAIHAAITEMGFIELPITALHAKTVKSLLPIHKDPFDRILIAQAQCEKMTLLTNDKTLKDYSSCVYFANI